MIMVHSGGLYGLAALAAAYVTSALNGVAILRLWQSQFLILFVLIISSICFGAAYGLAQWSTWYRGGSLLLFLCLLTLINAPFDWAALGLTRALLRRGLEKGDWWPYLLAVVDAMSAGAVIAAFTVVSVVSIQLFDDLAAHSGGDGARILPLVRLFDAIETHPSAPEFWWVYAMLISTMIPSFVNLMIGGASLVRGIPWVTKLLLRLMPERGTVPSYNRQWIATLLTAQVFVGAAIGIAAQVFLAYVVIGVVLPLFGLDLLALARAVAAPDLPGKLIAAVLG
jgi:hypothetical protein